MVRQRVGLAARRFACRLWFGLTHFVRSQGPRPSRRRLAAVKTSEDARGSSCWAWECARQGRAPCPNHTGKILPALGMLAHGGRHPPLMAAANGMSFSGQSPPVLGHPNRQPRWGFLVRNALGKSFERRRTSEEAALSGNNDSVSEDAKVDEGFLTHFGVPSDELVHAARVEAWEKIGSS
jgi:hypothetical protein